MTEHERDKDGKTKTYLLAKISKSKPIGGPRDPYTFGDKPINKRRIYEEDFEVRNPLSGYLGNKVNPRIR